MREPGLYQVNLVCWIGFSKSKYRLLFDKAEIKMLNLRAGIYFVHYRYDRAPIKLVYDDSQYGESRSCSPQPDWTDEALLNSPSPVSLFEPCPVAVLRCRRGIRRFLPNGHPRSRALAYAGGMGAP